MRVSLKDVPSNPTLATVDDITLTKGSDAAELTDEQYDRLKATGVKLATGESAGYEALSVDELQAQADARGLTVQGTGAGGNVLKSDLVAALEASDG